MQCVKVCVFVFGVFGVCMLCAFGVCVMPGEHESASGFTITVRDRVEK